MAGKTSGPGPAELSRRAVVLASIGTAGALVVPDTASAIGGLGGGGGGRGGDAGDGDDGDDRNRRYRTAGLRVEFVADGKTRYRFAYDVAPSERRGAHRISFNLITYIEKHKAWNRLATVGTFKQKAKVATKTLRPKPGRYAIEIMGHGFNYDVAVESAQKVEEPADERNRRESRKVEYVFTPVASRSGTV